MRQLRVRLRLGPWLGLGLWPWLRLWLWCCLGWRARLEFGLRLAAKYSKYTVESNKVLQRRVTVSKRYSLKCQNRSCGASNQLLARTRQPKPNRKARRERVRDKRGLKGLRDWVGGNTTRKIFRNPHLRQGTPPAMFWVARAQGNCDQG